MTSPTDISPTDLHTPSTDRVVSIPPTAFRARRFAFCALLLLMLFAASLFTGSVHLTPIEVWQALMGEGSDTARFVVWDSRLPGALTAVLAGAALSVGGLVMQTLFSNPLADPSLLGVNSGASLGAALVILLTGGSSALVATGWPMVSMTILAAFLGSLAVLSILLTLSRLLRDGVSLLVAGVMISFVVGAMIALLCFYASADGVRSFVVWGMGNFDSVGCDTLPLFALLVVLPCLCLLPLSLPLNALLLGGDYATNLGVNVRRMRTTLLLLTGLLTAVVTALCGIVSFIGLAVPHIARLVFRTADHRTLLPGTMLTGSLIALLAWELSRLPGQYGTLPLAAITPFLGVPVVIWLLVKR